MDYCSDPLGHGELRHLKESVGEVRPALCEAILACPDMAVCHMEDLIHFTMKCSSSAGKAQLLETAVEREGHEVGIIAVAIVMADQPLDGEAELAVELDRLPVLRADLELYPPCS